MRRKNLNPEFPKARGYYVGYYLPLRGTPEGMNPESGAAGLWRIMGEGAKGRMLNARVKTGSRERPRRSYDRDG